MIRVGLAGVGRIGARHADALCGLEEVDELIVADADADRARDLAEKLGDKVRAVSDIEALLQAELDGLVIATPTATHAELILHGVAARVPVFCEKPLATDLRESVDVLQRIADADGQVQIGFQRRFDPGHAAARAAVLSGSLGWVHTLRGCTLDPSPPPASYIATSGGILKDCSVHDIDAVRWVTGREVLEVYATGSNRGEDFFSEFDDVDTVAATLRLDDDAIALISATRYNGAGYDVRLEVLGSQGSVAVGLDEHTPLRSTEAGVAWPGRDPYPTFVERFEAAYTLELAAFVAFSSEHCENPCSAADALEALYVAEACEVSRHERRPVKVAEVRQ